MVKYSIASLVENSSEAESSLGSLATSSVESAMSNFISAMNLNVLKDRYKCSDVFSIAGIDLIRNQDRKNPVRVELARKIASSLAISMSEVFTGSERDSALVLAVRVAVVSDGCQRNEKIANLLGKGKAKGKGLAKVALFYCLFSRRTGEVAVCKRMSRTASGSCSEAPVLEMAADLRHKISQEVKFICCCRLGQWQELANDVLAVEDTDPTAEETENEGSSSQEY